VIERKTASELATNHSGPFALFALEDDLVSVWDLRRHVRVGCFRTIWDLGGQRLAIGKTGEFFVTASWERGIACFESRDGHMVWWRADLKHSQRLIFSNSSPLIYCLVDDGRLELLSPKDGSTLKSSPSFGNSVFENQATGELLANNKAIFTLWPSGLTFPSKSFAALDAAFGNHSICVSESAAPVRCIDAFSGEEKWSFDPGSGRHALRITYRDSDGCFYAAIWPYEEGGPDTMVRLHAETGESEELFSATYMHGEFCLAGECLLTSDGRIIEASTGAVEARLSL
jgi:outer membrane protein assembly factor BamB